MLVAAREGASAVDFDDYYPAMKACFERLRTDGSQPSDADTTAP
jgi:hypothetical protein